jgi:hypothetical protein
LSAPGLLMMDGIFAGDFFLERCLAERNLILNVSSVVWRRTALLEALARCDAELSKLKMAGDWRLYAEILAPAGARVAYVEAPLNRHRRHGGSVTHALEADRHVAEIARIQSVIARRLPRNAALAARQKRYLAEVSQQLGAGQLATQAAYSAV